MLPLIRLLQKLLDQWHALLPLCMFTLGVVLYESSTLIWNFVSTNEDSGFDGLSYLWTLTSVAYALFMVAIVSSLCVPTRLPHLLCDTSNNVYKGALEKFVTVWPQLL